MAYFIAVRFCLGMCRGQQTKHSSTLFPYTPPPAQPLPSLSPPTVRRTIWTLQGNAVRYRSYIGAAFQCNPHGVDDRVLHESEKGMQGETSSLRRILEKYIENSCPWHFSSLFFPPQHQFCTLASEGNVLSVGRGGGAVRGIERDAFFFFFSF